MRKIRISVIDESDGTLLDDAIVKIDDKEIGQITCHLLKYWIGDDPLAEVHLQIGTEGEMD